MSSAIKRRQQLAVDLMIASKVRTIAEEFGEQITDCIWRFYDGDDEYLWCWDNSCRVVDESDRVLFIYEPTKVVGESPVRAFADSPRWMARLEDLFTAAKLKRRARSAQRRLEAAERNRREFGLKPKE